MLSPRLQRRLRLWSRVAAVLVLLLIGVWFGGHPSWLPGVLRGAFVSKTADERQVQNVLDLISKNYYRPVNTNALLNDGLEGAVASLHDPYSHYYPPALYQSFQAETNPQVTGIGVSVDPQPVDGGVEIEEVFQDSPAARAGLQHGDVITTVDGKSLAGLSVDASAKLIQGKAGTTVKLTIKRGKRTFPVALKRANVVVPVASSKLIDYHGVHLGYLQFTSFTQNSAAELRGQVEKMQSAGAQGLILDLRDNGGGLLEQAIGVASIFIPSGTIVTTRGRNQPTTVYTAQGDATAPDIPLVVLVNRGTASSAEIVTGALKDRGRAKVVGTRTYGKGVFQQIQPLSGGGALDITVGEYFTPNGHNLGGGGVKRGRGITPSVYAGPGPNQLTAAEQTVAAEIK